MAGLHVLFSSTNYHHGLNGFPPDFEVKDPLPNVTALLHRSFAGSISTNRAAHGNNTLFFWGFEKEDGSLTAAADERIHDPWIIWLNGGPGSSRSVYHLTKG
jgi:carboxypeptidase D